MNGISINPANYSLKWEYFQSNIFQNSTSLSNDSKIEIDVHDYGYFDNETVIIWRLIVSSKIKGDIVICLKLQKQVNLMVELELKITSRSTKKFPMELILLLMIYFGIPLYFFIKVRIEKQKMIKN